MPKQSATGEVIDKETGRLPEELSELTQAWQNAAPLSHRKSLGQYMTPRNLRERLLEQCRLFPGMRVLDPGVGTGEFLRSVAEHEPAAKLFGWDVDTEILSVAKRNVPSTRLSHRCALDSYYGKPFDLVIGNPPYFQLKASADIKARFASVISGRPNIFALFMKAGLEALREGGQLAYVVPTSMNTGAYFNRLRDHILSCASVDFLEIYHDQHLFHEAQTPVQLLVLTKGTAGNSKNHSKFVFQHKTPHFSKTIFTADKAELEALFQNKSTLFALGYEAVTGTIVWNDHKEALRRQATNGEVPIIWSHNIQKTLKLFPDHKRPQYIQTNKPKLSGPAIVSNRIVGAVGTAKLRSALVPPDMNFVAENHVNVIRPHRKFPPTITFPQLLTKLQSPDTSAKINLLTANTQISATELTHLLPYNPNPLMMP